MGLRHPSLEEVERVPESESWCVRRFKTLLCSYLNNAVSNTIVLRFEQRRFKAVVLRLEQRRFKTVVLRFEQRRFKTLLCSDLNNDGSFTVVFCLIGHHGKNAGSLLLLPEKRDSERSQCNAI